MGAFTSKLNSKNNTQASEQFIYARPLNLEIKILNTFDEFKNSTVRVQKICLEQSKNKQANENAAAELTGLFSSLAIFYHTPTKDLGAQTSQQLKRQTEALFLGIVDSKNPTIKLSLDNFLNNSQSDEKLKGNSLVSYIRTQKQNSYGNNKIPTTQLF